MTYNNPPRNTVIKGQPHYLAYITPEEGNVLKERGGAGLPGPMGIPSYFDVGEGLGGYGSGMKDDATAGTGDPDAGRTDQGTYADDQMDLSDDRQYAAAQRVFNQARGITTSNPYGFEGIFSRVLGINPKNISYPNLNKGMTGTVFRDGIISRGGIMQGIPAAQYNAMVKTPAQRIADNQFSKFINPTNDKNKPGYNPEFPSAQEMGAGKLRSGVEKAGYQTTYGPVMEQARKQSTGEMLARGAFGLLAGLPGLALGQIGTKEYGLPGQPGFEDFDPNNPRPGGGMLGQVLGGLNPTQAAQKAAELKQSIIDEFTTPNVPGPVATSSSGKFGADADLRGFEERFGGTHPLSGETTVKSSGSSIVDGKTGFQTETLPDGSVRSVQTIGGISPETQRRSDEIFGPSMFPAAGNYGSRLSGEQLAGGFGIDTIGEALGRSSVELSPSVQDFLDEHGMSVRDLMDKDFSKVPDGARLPSGQIMGPEFRPNQTPPAPATDLQQLIRDAVSSRELGSPLSGGIIQLAGATGGTDVTNMTQDERGMYRVGQDPSMIQKAFEALGLRERKARPSGQFYSPGKSRSFFENPVGYIFGS
tara:strand:- start:12908 stop:14674 length:1767 start_codon:yes stop_codon:yes gene_type:complete